MFTGKHLCWNLFKDAGLGLGLQLYQKDTTTQAFSCEYSKTFKNTYFEEHLRMAASMQSTTYLRDIKYNSSFKERHTCK